MFDEKVNLCSFVQVEFVEEIADGEVLIGSFGTPFGTDDGANVSPPWNISLVEITVMVKRL